MKVRYTNVVKVPVAEGDSMADNRPPLARKRRSPTPGEKRVDFSPHAREVSYEKDRKVASGTPPIFWGARPSPSPRRSPLRAPSRSKSPTGGKGGKKGEGKGKGKKTSASRSPGSGRHANLSPRKDGGGATGST